MAGTSLAELMVGLVLLATVAAGVGASLIQLRKHSEELMSQVIAQSTAEGILEQIRREGFSTLVDFTAAAESTPEDYPSGNYETANDAEGTSYVTYRSTDLKFIAVDSENYAQVQTFALYWAADNETYCNVGARSDPDDLSSTVMGVLLDADYKDSVTGSVIRKRRYMPMRVNLTRKLNADANAVEITLRYRWAKPNLKTSSGTDVYCPPLEIRTAVSKIPTY